MSEIKYPKGERIWVRYCDGNGLLKFIMTTKSSDREYFYLYEFTDSQFKKLGRARDPRELEEKFEVDLKIRGG